MRSTRHSGFVLLFRFCVVLQLYCERTSFSLTLFYDFKQLYGTAFLTVINSSCLY